MILEGVKSRELLSTEKGNRVEIDTSSMHILQMLLSQNLYSDPVTAICAEYVNNGIDSVVQAGKDPVEYPVTISIARNQHNLPFSISIKDEGLGLNEEEFTSILGCYLKSTKRADNQTLGAFGIGSKSAFAITESFYYICRKDGVESKFLLYQGEEFTEYQKIFETPTASPNGVEVIIPIKNFNLYHEFVNKAPQKLCYYDTVVLLIEGKVRENKIWRNSLFQWSSSNTNHQLHFALRDVYYSIDYNKLGIAPIAIPICIRMSLEDGIMPTPSRESIIYSAPVIELFKAKIKLIADWFSEKYNDSVKEMAIDEIPDKWESLNPSGKKLITIEGKEFDIGGLLSYMSKALIRPKIKGIEALNTSRIHSLRDVLLKDWQVAATGNRASIRVSKNYTYRSVFQYVAYGSQYSYDTTKTDCRVFSCEKVPSGIYREYLQDEVLKDIGNYVFLRKTEHKDRLNWYKQNLFFKQDGITKDKWRTAIKEFLAIKKAFESKMEPLEAFQITDAWRDARKANRASSGPYNRTYVKKEEVNLREVVAGINKDSVLAAGNIIEVDNLEKKKIIIYGLPEQKDSIGRLRVVGLTVYCMAQRDIERVEAAKLPNWMTYEEYMKGNTSHFKKHCLKQKYSRYYDKITCFQGLDLYQEVDPWIKNTVAWFKQYYKYDSYHFVSREMIPVIENKDWWIDNEGSIKFAILLESWRTKDFSFTEHIEMYRAKGMELAKEVYYNRIKNQKEHEISNSWVVPDRL